MGCLFKVERLQNEAGANHFCLRYEFSHEKLSDIFPEVFEPLFSIVGPKKSRKIRTKFPTKFPCKISRKFIDELLQARRENVSIRGGNSFVVEKWCFHSGKPVGLNLQTASHNSSRRLDFCVVLAGVRRRSPGSQPPLARTNVGGGPLGHNSLGGPCLKILCLQTSLL